ncbi:hypothetical protein [Streptomyces melanogenes]|uniref:hypothetical protein n=1 Tax=Streptomyces melanogenes TaxID=67326 RepID=UPI00167D454E|nr:hypothetical protein [Streptomyces melanogenes]GGP80081.1 hypothetical protein GCM10010278_68160 [Streptomyces melanogenes]
MTTPEQYATRIQTDIHDVTVTSYSESVTAWSRRYFGPWWNATTPKPPYTGSLVEADVDGPDTASVAQDIVEYQHQDTVYANSLMVYRRTPGRVVLAAQPADQLAYRYVPGGGLRISGAEETMVALAAARLAREMVRGQLLAAGWTILHASAVTDSTGQAVLTFGPKGAGKTTCALLLARKGWKLLANDRVFVRPDGDGVRVLPWPSAAAIGLGLLDALDLYEPVAARVKDGEELHPTQDPLVTDALRTSSRTPIRNKAGKELKPQFFPDQLADWLGLSLATEGRAARLLFPTVGADTAPAVLDVDQRLGDDDFFTAETEDRYPDVFGLAPSTGTAAHEHVADVLHRLPRHTLQLGHDAAANTALLATVTA